MPRRNRAASEAKATDLVTKLRAIKLGATPELAENSFHETLAFFATPPYHWTWSCRFVGATGGAGAARLSLPGFTTSNPPVPVAIRQLSK